MWITNIELEKRIKELEKKLIQNNEPNTWQYKWQIWFDEVEWVLKYWDWFKYINWGSSSWGKIRTWYASIPSWYTDYAITWVWFKPKAIQVVVYNWNKVAWWYADDVWWTIWQRCIYADSWAFSEQNWRLFRFDNINRWYLVSFDSDWFTVKSELNAVMIWTAFW